MATSSPPQVRLSASFSADGSDSSIDFSRQGNATSLPKKGRRSRSNTVEEKRRMRRERIRRKKRGSKLAKLKDKVCQLQCEVRAESSEKVKCDCFQEQGQNILGTMAVGT